MLGNMSDRHAWREVADAVLAGMGERGFTQKELAERSGVSTATLRKLTSGVPNRYRPQTLSRVSIALGWPSGRLKAISEGLADDNGATAPEELAAKIAKLPPHRRRIVAELVEDFLGA